MIDEYLAAQNDRDVLKQAFDIAKPYFFDIVSNKIEEESLNVLQSVQSDKTIGMFILNYFTHFQNPHLRNSKIVDRMNSFNANRDRKKFMDIAFPDQRANYVFKMIAMQMGNN